ncbi:MAG TPA: hypothetical protein VGK58_17755, partial [Lacipirellulaceae bacterium]
MIVESGNWSALVWTHIWQIGLLGSFVGIINLFLARRWPHLAYALWMVVLVKCFVPPIGNWPVNVLGRLTPIATSTANGALSSDDAPIRTTTDSSRATFTATDHGASNGAARAEKPPALQATRPDSVSQRSIRSLTGRAAPLAWLCGSVFLCGIAIGRGSEIHRRLRRTSSVPSDEV